ncbi:MAG TPA: c-type cytochrome [Longimicrobium sp.]|nr:c-type cytochrome [Longimicrobium sp.]
MQLAHARRTRPALLALALGAALAGGCRPGGDYGYDRVSYRRPPEDIRATNPDPPEVRAGLVGAPQKIVAKNLPAGVTQAMVDQGQELFGNPCAGCHGAGGTGSPAAPALNDGEWLNVGGSYPEIVAVINAGVANPKQFAAAMPPKGGGTFDDAQVRSLAAYVYALSQQGES